MPEDPRWWLDPRRCQEISRDLRYRSAADGLILPSVAFLAQADRWNAVVFAEHDDLSLAERIAETEPVGWCRFEATRRTAPRDRPVEERDELTSPGIAAEPAGVATWLAWTRGWVRVGRA